MTPDELMARVLDYGDQLRAETLSLMETLSKKTHNHGAVRRCEPLLTEADCQAILERVPAIAAGLREERMRAVGVQPSGLLLPPNARTK